ncbi:hypothetical protein C8Q75DRAFT_724359 [Abortiporus biennis]|nr:hypothetical protein C8Q75DRAFT_724359 [Abortiporus biennis]
MRQVPQEVTRFLREKYPKPIVDQEWLEGCYNWTVSDLGLIPATQMDAILHNVESQLLQSNLSDSMRPSTGLPPTVSQIQKGTLTGAPILVEIISLTEIGNSAYNLMNVRQQRIDRADLAGLNANNDNNDDGEDEGPVPKYPRSMLRFQLSDGSTTLEAIELKRLPGLELGETPLGFKVSLHKFRRFASSSRTQLRRQRSSHTYFGMTAIHQHFLRRQLYCTHFLSCTHVYLVAC